MSADLKSPDHREAFAASAGDLHRLGVCGHVIVGYNVAIGGDEEARTFADRCRCDTGCSP